MCLQKKLLFHFGEIFNEEDCGKNGSQQCLPCKEDPVLYGKFEVENIRLEAKQIQNALLTDKRNFTTAQFVEMWKGVSRSPHTDHIMYETSHRALAQTHQVLYTLLSKEYLHLAIEMHWATEGTSYQYLERLRPGPKIVGNERVDFLIQQPKQYAKSLYTAKALEMKQKAVVAVSTIDTNPGPKVIALVSPMKKKDIDEIVLKRKKKVKENEENGKTKKKDTKHETPVNMEKEKNYVLNSYIEGNAETGYWCRLCKDDENFSKSKKAKHTEKYHVRRHIKGVHFSELRNIEEITKKGGKPKKKIIRNPKDKPTEYVIEKFSMMHFCVLCKIEDPYGQTNGKWKRGEVTKHVQRIHFRNMNSYECDECHAELYGPSVYNKHKKGHTRMTEKIKAKILKFWQNEDLVRSLRNAEASKMRKQENEEKKKKQKDIY